jgi:hypothetical protein
MLAAKWWRSKRYRRKPRMDRQANFIRKLRRKEVGP